MPVSLVDLSVPPAAEWDRLLESATSPIRFFHTAAAARCLAQAFPEYEDRRYRARFDDGSDILLPLILARRRTPSLSSLLGLPLSWPGTPVVLAGSLDRRKLQVVLDAVPDAGRLHLFGGGIPGEHALDGDEEMETHLLELAGGFEETWANRMTGNTRNMCRKAEKAGLRVEEVPAAEGLDAFYGLYAHATAGWGYDTPPYPRALFEALAGAEGVEMCLAWIEDRPVAGTISLRGSSDLFQWCTVMDRAHRDAAPTNGLLCHVIRDACARGFHWYDMGSSHGLPGVASFKESFGATRVTFNSGGVSTLKHRLLSAGAAALGKLRSTPSEAT